MWRRGCIIRSRFLGNIKTAFTGKPDLHDLLLDAFSIDALKNAEAGWRTATALGTELGIPLPAFRSALAFYDGYHSGKLPANLLEAQRDYFGAHTYERVDRPRGKFFHTDWTRTGGFIDRRSVMSESRLPPRPGRARKRRHEPVRVSACADVPARPLCRAPRRLTRRP